MSWDVTCLTVNHSSPLPLHYQLSQLLCAAIASGDLKPGDCIPPETDIVEHLGISRATVRQAISGLVNRGLLYRKKGKGTFVAAPKIDGGFFAKLESFHQEMLEKGLTPSTRVLQWERIPPDGEINAVLELPPDAPLLLLRRLRFANGMPVVQVDTYLSAQLFGGHERKRPYRIHREVSLMFTGLLRTIILYILIIAGVRLMGKRQVGELEPSELVLSLIIADLASVPMQDYGIPLLTGVVPILTLLSVTMILSVLTMKSVRFRAILCGRPSMVIRNGMVDQREMAKNRLTVDELLEELRIQGYTDLSTVKYAILETNGQLSVLPYANQKPPTARDMKVSVEEGGLPRVVVSDGKLLERNLKALGHDRPWLDRQLSQRGCRDLSKVFLLLVDESDAVYFAEKEG